MGYSTLKNSGGNRRHEKNSLEALALRFIRDYCEDLRFDQEKTAGEDPEKRIFSGTSIRSNQIPYNMQMDIDRLCLENAIERFLESGKKEDAFDVYFCYLEMFLGKYEKTRRMVEVLSECEGNSSGLLMGHRDPYSHSVWVFAQGLAVFVSNVTYRDAYMKHYHLANEHQAACHYLQYWGFASLFRNMDCFFKSGKIPFQTESHLLASMLKSCGERQCQERAVSDLSGSSFIDLYKFALVLNGRWKCGDVWRRAREAGQEEKFLNDESVMDSFEEMFQSLSLEYKLANINQAKAFAGHMTAIGCFYTDKAVDLELLDRFTEEERMRIGVREHQRWLQIHVDMGWVYGTPDKADRELFRQHEDMIPDFDYDQAEVSLEQAKENYERLDKAGQDKDTEPMECMLAMFRLFYGMKVYRL